LKDFKILKSSTKRANFKRGLIGAVPSLWPAFTALTASSAHAQKKYDVGADDKVIRFGQTMPYSGPASAWSAIGKAQSAYFKMLNEKGGINGRSLEFISVDDGYAPPKTVEMTRKLVEQEEVLFIMGTLGTPSNSAIHRYLNTKKVPHLFLATGANKWNDPKNFPWTMGWQPNYQSEGKVYATHLLRTRPDGKVAVLFQNDDFGKDYLKGFKEGLGERAKTMIIAELSYEITDPSVDSQIVAMKASGADVFFNVGTPKFAAQAIRKVHDLGWKPLHYLIQVSALIGSVLTPAGLEKSVGLISTQYLKDVSDQQWANDAGMKEYRSFMARYLPDADIKDGSYAYGYSIAQTTAHVLGACGDDLTRANLMREASNIKALQLPMAIPGVVVATRPDDFAPLQSMQLVRFDGSYWAQFGEVISVR
jgi:branched-chain amino acid transport system substrate-binding protein